MTDPIRARCDHLTTGWCQQCVQKLVTKTLMGAEPALRRYESMAVPDGGTVVLRIHDEKRLSFVRDAARMLRDHFNRRGREVTVVVMHGDDDVSVEPGPSSDRGETSRITIPAAQVEFDDGGHTMWVIAPNGGTLLRLKLQNGGSFCGRRGCENVCSHADLTITELLGPVDVDVCLTNDAT